MDGSPRGGRLAFGASTFGHLHADGVKFLDRVGRCLRDRQLLGDGKDFSIQKGIAKQLVAHLVCSGSD